MRVYTLIGENMADTVELKPVLDNTVREFPENEHVGGSSLWDLFISRPYEIIAPYGTRQRAIDLREFSVRVHNTLVQGAFASFIQRVVSTPYEISGDGARKIYQWQDIFQQAEFNEGWEGLLEPVLWDFLTQDVGAFIEIIGPGPKDKAMTGAAVGVGHLDALRCIATGNPEFPVVYYSEITNKLHRLHQTRVVRLVDMRSPDTRSRGMGFCLHGDSSIKMADGRYERISTLVKNRCTDEVKTIDVHGHLTTRPITNWYTNERQGRALINIRGKWSQHCKGVKRRNTWVTEDHRISTPDGWKEAGQLRNGDAIYSGFPKPNHRQMQLIVGTLLGDASITNYKNLPRMSMGQQMAHEEWIRLKMCALQEFDWQSRFYRNMVHTESKAQPALEATRVEFYPNGKKVIPLRLVNEYFSPLMLAAWYMDDGWITQREPNPRNRRPYASIGTSGAIPIEVEAIADLLTQRGYTAHAVASRGKASNQKNIQFTADASTQLYRDIAPYIPECMRYKLPYGLQPFKPELWDLGNADVFVDEAIIQHDDGRYCQTVYCIDVEETHNFITAGIVVHNCALSRMLSVANAQTLLGRHQNELLSDMPPPGIIITNNIHEGQLNEALNQYEHDRIADAQWVYRPLAHVGNIDKTTPASMEVIPFRTTPEDFDREKYIRVDVNLIALALCVDPQDIWPLTGAALGTATQSEVLHAKGRGKGIGYVLKRLARAINIKMLPPDLEWQSKHKDGQQDQEQAETAKLWAGVASELQTNGTLSKREARQLLANTVEVYADVLLDEQGNLRIMDEESEQDVDVVAEDFTPLPTLAETATNGAAGAAALAGDGASRQALRANADLDRQQHAVTVVKAIEATRVEFENAYALALGNATEMRSLLQRYSREAYTDGLEHGGIEDAELDDEDRHTLDEWLVEQSSFVSDFVDRESEFNAENKAVQWWAKSVYPMYLAGIRAADENGLYSWSLGSAEVHCEDCQRLAGQKHRFRDWLRSEYMPKSEKLACMGFQCTCSLVRARGKPSGAF